MVDISVLAHKSRKALVLPFLDKPTVWYSNDYEFPEGWKPGIGLEHVTHNHLAAMRCFRGHQDLLGHVSNFPVLVFEDDAIPNMEDWRGVVENAVPLLEEFDVVSLHGRNYDLSNNFTEHSKGCYVHKISSTWIVGSLAYLMKKETADKIRGQVYQGLPWDLLLYRTLKYCVIHPSPFNHDTREGSLIDT